MSNQYRIEDRQNVYLAGSPATLFRLFERNGDAYCFAGQYSASGHDVCTDDCIAAAVDARGSDDANDF